mmetsp:Transcript_58278/g.177630  ORF Transcript_58278/g.177630 Transcript_58278/m.177630 type:complete len:205 (+) Transcript_58278:434-1048(+)
MHCRRPAPWRPACPRRTTGFCFASLSRKHWSSKNSLRPHPRWTLAPSDGRPRAVPLAGAPPPASADRGGAPSTRRPPCATACNPARGASSCLAPQLSPPRACPASAAKRPAYASQRTTWRLPPFEAGDCPPPIPARSLRAPAAQRPATCGSPPPWRGEIRPRRGPCRHARSCRTKPRVAGRFRPATPPPSLRQNRPRRRNPRGA